MGVMIDHIDASVEAEHAPEPPAAQPPHAADAPPSHTAMRTALARLADRAARVKAD